MSVEEKADPVDLGGGCGGDCGGCGGGASGSGETEPPAREAVVVPSAVRVARVTFVLGLLLGVGMTALLGALLPQVMPFVAAAVLAAAAVGGIVAVLRRPASAEAPSEVSPSEGGAS